MDRADFGFPACSREMYIGQSCRLFALYAIELQIVISLLCCRRSRCLLLLLLLVRPNDIHIFPNAAGIVL